MTRLRAILPTTVCFLLPMAVYCVTAARFVQGGDTGEFAWVGLAGGVAHPPGYPLFTVLVAIAGHLPFGTPFYRAALASALTGASACAVLQCIGARLTGRPWIGAAAALVFAFSSLEWRLSDVPEVFTLNVLAASLLVLMALRLMEPSRAVPWAALFAWGLVMGLGVSNHQTIVFLLPLGAGAGLSIWRRFGTRAMTVGTLVIIAGGVVGLSPYLLLLWTGRIQDTHAWVWGDTQTFHGLIRHVLRRDFGTFQLYGQADRAQSPWHQLAFFARQLPADLTIPGCGAILLGVVAGARRRIPLAWALLTAFALSGVLFLAIINTPASADWTLTERFHLLPEAMLVPFLAVGLGWIAEQSRRSVAAAIAVLLAVTSIASHWKGADWSRKRTLDQYLRTLVASVEPGAIIFGDGDHLLYGMGYLTEVLGVGNGRVHFVSPALLRWRWYRDLVHRDVPGWPSLEGRPLFATLASMARVRALYVVPGAFEEAAARKMDLEPDGFLYRLKPQGTPAATLGMAVSRLEKATMMLGDQPAPLDDWDRAVRGAEAAMWTPLCQRLAGSGDAQRAQSCFTTADLVRGEAPGSSRP